MPRIFCDEDLSQGRQLRLPDVGARHLVRVLRLRRGDDILLFDGVGRECRAVITRVHGSAVEAMVSEPVATLPASPLHIRLLQGVCRGERMDWVIQKATELGVAAVHPIVTERGVVKLKGDRARSRTRHWAAVAVAACEQCGRSLLPEILPPTSFQEALSDPAATGLRLVLDAREGVSMTDLTRPDGAVSVLVGPEGGLTPDERQAARSHGFEPVRMGPRVLRTETAALTALVLLQSLWGDLSASPTPSRSA